MTLEASACSSLAKEVLNMCKIVCMIVSITPEERMIAVIECSKRFMAQKVLQGSQASVYPGISCVAALKTCSSTLLGACWFGLSSLTGPSRPNQNGMTHADIPHPEPKQAVYLEKSELAAKLPNWPVLASIMKSSWLSFLQGK